MEPQLIDYYNSEPHMVNVIDKMNEELEEVVNKNIELENDNKIIKKKLNDKINIHVYSINRNVTSISILHDKHEQLQKGILRLEKTIDEFLSSTGWTTSIRKPYWGNKGILSIKGLGNWDTRINTGIPDDFLSSNYNYGSSEYIHNQIYYCSYLKLKLLEQLFDIFEIPLKNQCEHGLFHTLLDGAFLKTEYLVIQILKYDIDVSTEKLQNIMKKEIIRLLINDNRDTITDRPKSDYYIIPLFYMYVHDCTNCEYTHTFDDLHFFPNKVCTFNDY